jgi:CDP-diacylglycerol---serine O-phosphatidyltransferase
VLYRLEPEGRKWSDMSADRKSHFSMVRSFALADLFTFGNASCGTGAIFLCLSYLEERNDNYLWWAFVLLPLALLFDVLDGKIARLRNKHSTLGADLDSLADVVSFGVAPAALGFTLGLRGGWDILCLLFFVSCGISRLARYNVTAAALSDSSGKVKYYEGTPIPSSLFLVMLWALAFYQGRIGENLWWGSGFLLWKFHWYSLVYVLNGCTMISATLRIPKP